MAPIKEKLKKQIEIGIDLSCLEVKNWPRDESGNPQDLENWGIVELTDDMFKLSCGGDGQLPKTMEIRFIGDHLEVTNIEDGFDEGMKNEEFVKLLYS